MEFLGSSVWLRATLLSKFTGRQIPFTTLQPLHNNRLFEDCSDQVSWNHGAPVTIRLLSIREWNGNRLPYGLLRDSDNLSSEHFAHPFTALLRSPSDLSHCPLADQLCRNVVVEQEASLLAPTSSEEGRHVPADGSESISCFITTPLMVLGTVAAVSVSFEMHYQNICASFFTSHDSLRDMLSMIPN